MWLVPRNLLGQLFMLILVAFVAAQVTSAWLFADERGEAIRAAQRLETLERAMGVTAALDATPIENRDDLLSAVNSRLVQFSVNEEPLVEVDRSILLTERGIADVLNEISGVMVAETTISPHDGQPAEPPMAFAWLHDRMRAAGVAPVEFQLSIPLADGAWLNVSSRFQRPGIQRPPAVLGAMLLSLSLIFAALWGGLRRIMNPLRQLAAAADEFELDTPSSEIPTSGPREVRALSKALTRMQTRLAMMVEDRTRMMAALGHDLRSPITALRLRAEMVDDDEIRARMVATLDEMQEMVEATLSYARGVSIDQPMKKTDLAALVGDLASELSEIGTHIVVEAPTPVVANVRRTAIRRALRNLMENAQRYGGGARVRVRTTGVGQVEVQIDDNGPGIPTGDLERVFDPFTRLEGSRSRETGGVGLGLPIARSILRAHGGDVTLSSHPDGGLRAGVQLPRT